jgi:hypothetical protein
MTIPIVPKWLSDLKKEIKWDTIRMDGRLERTCEHGIGHTVGDIKPERLKDKWHGLHGCDKCCEEWPRQEVPK